MTWRAILWSLIAWGGFALFLFFRWNGLTFANSIRSLWLLLPYGMILMLLIDRPSKLKLWLALVLSFGIGVSGTFEYYQRTIVHLSGMSGNVFSYVPLVQLAAVMIALTTFGTLTYFSRKSTKKEKKEWA